MTNTIRYLSAKLGSRALQSLLGLLLCLPVYADSLCTPEEQEIALAMHVYHEDRVTEKGMVAVGQVVINRANDPRWGYDLCEVIYQPSNNPLLPKKCAMSWTCDDVPDATLETERYELAEKVAKYLISGYYDLDPVFGALYYYRCELHGKDSWMNNLDFVVQVGLHCYYIDK